VSTATPELSLESAAAWNPYLEAAPDPSSARDTPFAVPQKSNRASDFRRPVWLSPELVAFPRGALDWGLILAAAIAAFAVYFGVMEQTVAWPERHILIAFLAATVFVGIFEQLGGYRSKQLSGLNWQMTRILMTWGFTLAVLLLAAFLSKRSEIYSRGRAVVWIIGTSMLLLIGRSLVHIAFATRAGGSYLARNIGGSEGQRLIARLREEQDKSVIIRGVFCGFNVLGTTDYLLNFERQVTIDEVIMALPFDAEQRLRSLCDKVKAMAISMYASALSSWLKPSTYAASVMSALYRCWRRLTGHLRIGARCEMDGRPIPRPTVVGLRQSLDGGDCDFNQAGLFRPACCTQLRFGFNNGSAGWLELLPIIGKGIGDG
jgi:hypothetical protein